MSGMSRDDQEPATAAGPASSSAPRGPEGSESEIPRNDQEPTAIVRPMTFSTAPGSGDSSFTMPYIEKKERERLTRRMNKDWRAFHGISASSGYEVLALGHVDAKPMSGIKDSPTKNVLDSSGKKGQEFRHDFKKLGEPTAASLQLTKERFLLLLRSFTFRLNIRQEPGSTSYEVVTLSEGNSDQLSIEKVRTWIEKEWPATLLRAKNRIMWYPFRRVSSSSYFNSSCVSTIQSRIDSVRLATDQEDLGSRVHPLRRPFALFSRKYLVT